ncbi:hypothetical protein ElyMa_002919900 [Elysia marginata]|uniref:Uncharacterized protein n=1 Tax=Elysia marginata TaxID=1093978 RepID=A0AAV4I6P0_9GAST|nr:hypothetical protein ElyMa_002919900 [Elysia marginata]
METNGAGRPFIFSTEPITDVAHTILSCTFDTLIMETNGAGRPFIFSTEPITDVAHIMHISTCLTPDFYSEHQYSCDECSLQFTLSRQNETSSSCGVLLCEASNISPSDARTRNVTRMSERGTLPGCLNAERYQDV